MAYTPKCSDSMPPDPLLCSHKHRRRVRAGDECDTGGNDVKRRRERPKHHTMEPSQNGWVEIVWKKSRGPRGSALYGDNGCEVLHGCWLIAIHNGTATAFIYLIKYIYTG